MGYFVALVALTFATVTFCGLWLAERDGRKGWERFARSLEDQCRGLPDEFTRD